ncbi:MAG: hypothetical protein LBO65_05185 [Spirochaetaceae bacterium]|nr:hypothetical protein [Spirochaetaceae bacterium]
MRIHILRGAALTVLAWIVPWTVSAEKPPFSSSRELSLQISSLPEAKLGFTQRLTFPLLQGTGPLTADNNIALALTAEISPVSLNVLAETVWTPAAFFNLSAGGRIGSGWNVHLLGQNLYGIGLNREDGSGRAEHSGAAFDGLLWKVQTGAALQFDLAALIPGDWHHVVARTYHEINHRGYTAAASGESWYYENDDGENCNGFNYYGNLLMGYQMPVFLTMAGFLAEGTLYLYDTPNRTRWGDEKMHWVFSAIFNFTLTGNLSAALLVQCKTRRNYQNANWEDLYYRRRDIDRSNPLRLTFYRAAVVMTCKL